MLCASAGQQQSEPQQQHGPLRSRSTTPRAGAQRLGTGRSSSPELADFLDAAAVALWHVPYLRERLTSLQVIALGRCGVWSQTASISACWQSDETSRAAMHAELPHPVYRSLQAWIL